MECKFWVGQKVVCVDANPNFPGARGHPCAAPLIEGAVYTIRDIGFTNKANPTVLAVRLVEVVNENAVYKDQGMSPLRFRPATDISIFHDIVAKVKTGNRDLVPAGAMR